MGLGCQLLLLNRLRFLEVSWEDFFLLLFKRYCCWLQLAFMEDIVLRIGLDYHFGHTIFVVKF